MKCQATVTLGRETFDRVMQRVESLQCLFCGYMIAKKNKERKGTTQRKTFVCQRKACTDTVLVYWRRNNKKNPGFIRKVKIKKQHIFGTKLHNFVYTCTKLWSTVLRIRSIHFLLEINAGHLHRSLNCPRLILRSISIYSYDCGYFLSSSTQYCSSQRTESVGSRPWSWETSCILSGISSRATQTKSGH